jgi:hypothetical protein
MLKTASPTSVERWNVTTVAWIRLGVFPMVQGIQAAFNSPTGITITQNGTIYISDFYNYKKIGMINIFLVCYNYCRNSLNHKILDGG